MSMCWPSKDSRWNQRLLRTAPKTSWNGEGKEGSSKGAPERAGEGTTEEGRREEAEKAFSHLREGDPFWRERAENWERRRRVGAAASQCCLLARRRGRSRRTRATESREGAGTRDRAREETRRPPKLSPPASPLSAAAASSRSRTH